MAAYYEYSANGLSFFYILTPILVNASLSGPSYYYKNVFLIISYYIIFPDLSVYNERYYINFYNKIGSEPKYFSTPLL